MLLSKFSIILSFWSLKTIIASAIFIDSYSSDYGLTLEKLSLNSREIPILHPGPINRGIEISSEVVDEYPNCLINNQVANGIPIRMALLYLLKKYNK